MATRSIIKQLHRAINERQSQDVINSLSHLITENITEASEDPVFYSLPFEQIINIIKRVEFLNPNKVDNPIAVLKTLIQQTSQAYPEEAVLLLNVIKVNNLPPLLPDDIIPIISKFTNCNLLTKLGELHEYNQRLLTPDYEGENEELRERIRELEEQVRTLQENIFQPVTEQPSDFVENLFDACEQGKLDSVQYHFEVLGADKRAVCKKILPGDDEETRGLTLLHVAAAYGQLGIVKYLCDVVKVYTEETCYGYRDRYRPLHIACCKGHLPVVQYLIDVQKVDKEATDNERRTPLHIACLNNQLPIVQYLCEVAHVNAEAKGVKGRTPLHIACLNNNLPMVQYLCEVAHVDTEIQDACGQTALNKARYFRQLQIVQYLCEVAHVDTQ